MKSSEQRKRNIFFIFYLQYIDVNNLFMAYIEKLLMYLHIVSNLNENHVNI